MASFNVYVAFGVLTIMASGVVMARDVDRIKANNCEPKMAFYYVTKVFTSIFKTGIVTDNCCIELIGLGQFCHDALIRKTLQNPLFKNNNTWVLLSRGAQVWNKCNLVNKDVSSSFSPY
ncbi:uncharacterized protein LOC110419750 [Herrania umbratica]|uniref:Uncharacterized protein LOC110419750 n=1 Tax=Herrania umbratica TaxID=108875 RepID=A0A6J1ANV4_9ROSI|nr:uncharacterized protein LOC110419750 [Herrania umbratica]